jgi:SAM-dependent methyltransferase
MQPFRWRGIVDKGDPGIMQAVKRSSSWEEELELVQNAIKRKSAENGQIEILEAGCGKSWPIDLSGVKYRLTGIDLDAEALQIRKDVNNDLDETIVGDLCTHDLPPESFHVIYSSFVLEHIENADVALANLAKWLKPGGIMIIKIPDRDSVHGLVTRLTPHWLHVLYVRFALGSKDAGRPGHAPYRAYYHPIVSRRGVRKFCEERGLRVSEECVDAFWNPGTKLFKPIIKTVKYMIWLLTFARFAAGHNNLLLILEKDSAGSAEKA